MLFFFVLRIQIHTRKLNKDIKQNKNLSPSSQLYSCPNPIKDCKAIKEDLAIIYVKTEECYLASSLSLSLFFYVYISSTKEREERDRERG